MTALAVEQPFVSLVPGFVDVTGPSPQLVQVVSVDAHEGPVYLPDEDALYFTSVPAHRQVAIKRLALDGMRFPLEPERVSVLVAEANAANGMARDAQGRLVVCEQGSRSRPARISLVDRGTGQSRTAVDALRGLALNSPNDVVVRSDGTLWFTDPSYGFLQGFKDQPQLGDYVYRYDPGTDTLTVVADGFDKPNGLAFSPDEQVLYIGDSRWRFAPTRIEEIDFVDVGPDLGPSGAPNRTYDLLPHAEGVDHDDSGWMQLSPADTQRRLSTGRVCFAWYRITVTLPERVGDFPVHGSTVLFEVVVDDYAEVWVDGVLPLALGTVGGHVVAGFNAPNRVVLTADARPGQTFTIAVCGINGPLSVSPHNYIWMRTSALDFYAPEAARTTEDVPVELADAAAGVERIVPAPLRAERVATDLPFTEGPVWTPDGALLFSSPNTNTIYRWSQPGTVSVFQSHSGYSGVDIGRYHQPGSNGLTFDPQGRLVICQHGNRRVLRVEPHGNTTVLADRYEGKRLNSPNDVVCRSDGTVFFTDPPFGLPGGAEDPKRELPISGVFAARDGKVVLVSDELAGPNGLAFSPDERYLYLCNWEAGRSIVLRYEVGADGDAGPGELLVDLSDVPGEDSLDGMKVDQAGHLYICGPGGIHLIAPDGRRLGLIRLPEAAHNLAWGDADAATLYVTAMTSIYRIRLGIPGIRPTARSTP